LPPLTIVALSVVNKLLYPETIHVINSIQGVIKFVGTGRLPMPLRQDEVNRLLGIEAAVPEEEPTEAIPFLIGQVVEITEGPFSDFSGTVEEVIPDKGKVLTQISAFWFQRFQKIDNHFVTADFDQFPAQLKKFRDQLAGRSMIVRKTIPLTVECVVRGYLAGSGWKEYQQSQSVCGIQLPPNLQLASPLPKAIFTPSTKAEQGHDERESFHGVPHMKGSIGLVVTSKVDAAPSNRAPGAPSSEQRESYQARERGSRESAIRRSCGKTDRGRNTFVGSSLLRALATVLCL